MKVILISIFIFLAQFSFSQNSDSTFVYKDKSISPVSFLTAFTLTTKGISTLPNLTLGKPAVFFDLVLSKGDISFEPNFRFALLTGKPWSFQFWGRYKMIQSEKFKFDVRARPVFNFSTKSLTINNITGEEVIVKRNIGGELIPVYNLTKNISLESVYSFIYGVDKNMTKYIHFISLRTYFSNIFITDDVWLKLAPQIYYLKMDTLDGFYFGSSLDLMKKDFPLSLQSMFNKEIRSNLEASPPFLWNVSLIYTFKKQYIEKPQKKTSIYY